MHRPAILACALAALVLSACSARYVTPGAGADFRALGITPAQADALTDPTIAQRLARQPAAAFPATIAAIRVQDSGYRSYTSHGYGHGVASVVTTRDIERDDDYQRLSRLPMVRAVVPINRLVVTPNIRTEEDLRSAAASVHADLTLLYTLDTRFGTETTIPALGVITLGLFPDKEARVTSTASAALIDTRTGYVYALAESTDDETQIANAWTSQSAVDQSRRRAERHAFEGLLSELERSWKTVAESYATRPASPPPSSFSTPTITVWPLVPMWRDPSAPPPPQGPVYRTRPG